MNLIAIDMGDGRTVYRFPKDHEPPKRASLHAPYVNSDAMDPVQSMVDGKMYTSKSALRATYKPGGNAEGKEYQELGNDPARLRLKPKTLPDRAAIRESIKRAADKVQSS